MDIPFGVTPIELPDRAAALLWIEENQLARRNLSDDQRAVMVKSVAKRRAALRAKLQREEAAEAAAAAKKRGTKTSERDTVSRPDKAQKIKTGKNHNAALAKEHNLPERKLRQAGEVLDNAADLENKVRSGEMTLAQAKREIQERQTPEEAPAPKHSNPHAEYLRLLRDLDTPRFLDTIKALPPTDYVKEQILELSRKATKRIRDIQERITQQYFAPQDYQRGTGGAEAPPPHKFN